MSKIFKSIQEMIDRDMDIQASTTMLGINKHPQGAVLKVGVSEECISKLASNDYIFCLLVINKKELKSIEQKGE